VVGPAGKASDRIGRHAARSDVSCKRVRVSNKLWRTGMPNAGHEMGGLVEPLGGEVQIATAVPEPISRLALDNCTETANTAAMVCEKSLNMPDKPAEYPGVVKLAIAEPVLAPIPIPLPTEKETSKKSS